jgi:hypothetical protein
MKSLQLDIEEVAFVMEVHDNFDTLNLLDTETGDIVNVYRGLILALKEGNGDAGKELPPWQQGVVEKAKQVFLNGNGRYQEIPRQSPTEAYQLMVEFAQSVAKRHLKEELHGILNNGAAFRGFVQAVMKHPDEYNRWFEFSGERMRQKVLDWLKSLEIEPEKHGPETDGRA